MVATWETKRNSVKFSSELILEIGESYETRGHGPDRKATIEVRKIIRRFPASGQYEFEDNEGAFYTKHGKFHSNGHSRHDLVKKVN